MSQLIREYILGDMTARYVTDENKEQVGLLLLPKDMPCPVGIVKELRVDSLVQIKLVGDIYDEAYALGNSMRNGESVRRLKFKEQTVETQEIEAQKQRIKIITKLTDSRGYEVRHILCWKSGDVFVRVYCVFENQSREAVSLEMFESFSLSEISPYLEGDGHNQLDAYRIRSVWSQEGRLEITPIEDLQLEPAWDPHAVRCEKFGQAGSMPVNKFFPFLAVLDKTNHVFWGAQIAHNASWQIEMYRKDNGLAISGGLADRDFGHWLKRIDEGESFRTPTAILSVCRTNSIDILTKRLTDAGQDSADAAPAIEQELPIVFNEYCTTWGCPSHENIKGILEKIKDKGFTYFVIDCGWYKEKDVPWDISMGDYEVSDDLFPEGLKKTVEAIRDTGLIPGVWFEIENVGSASRAYQMEEHLLQKDGKTLTSYFRRFWDMRDPWVESYLTEKVIGTLQKYGFGYMKIDYNETIGIGCDGAESLGEGLRQNMAASAEFYEKVKREVPQIVLENCASGGHRLEPGLMGQMSMASFSDAHECEEIPVIAANLHRVILPRQSQIWAVIRKTDSLKRIAYSLTNTFLGRMCISGDVTELSAEQWDVIEGSIAFYKKISPIIKKGQSYLYGTEIKSTRHPQGWQGVVRIGENGQAYVTIHTFEGELPEIIEIPLPAGMPEHIEEIYSYGEESVMIENHVLRYRPVEDKKGIAVLLK